MKSLTDSFIFFNEVDLLKIRLEYLGDEVDYFVICEANVDFSGKPKKLVLQNHISELPYSHKIIYRPVNINLFSIIWLLKRFRWITRHHKFLWKIQDAQRNAVKNLIEESLLMTDYILFGDLDEIPNVELLKSLRNEKILIKEPKTLRQRLFYYHPDIATNDEAWFGTICSSMESFSKTLPHKLRSQRENLEFIVDGGYHLSYFMQPKDMKIKIDAIADVEKISNSKELTLQEIEEYVLNQKDLFGRDLGFIRAPQLLPLKLKLLIHRYMPWTR
jgi:beta-1,4-mannosyl-glycoprotein beta-1,4-N-acetylglucosaminyltransferase